MVSKMVTDRQKSSESVQAAGRTHGDLVANGFAKLFGEEAEPAIRILFNLFVKRLAADTKVMIDADDANIKELADDPGGLARRDESTADTYSSMTDFREVGAAVYGREYMRLLGFDGPTPRDPTALERLAALILEAVASTTPPAPRRSGLSLDPAQWTEPLTASRTDLSKALKNVADENREAEATLVAKNDAIAGYDRTFSATATLIAAMLGFVDQKELARRVRPSSRRPGQTAEVAESEGAADLAPVEPE